MSFLVLCIRNDAGVTYTVVPYARVTISIDISPRKERIAMFMSSVLVGSVDVEQFEIISYST